MSKFPQLETRGEMMAYNMPEKALPPLDCLRGELLVRFEYESKQKDPPIWQTREEVLIAMSERISKTLRHIRLCGNKYPEFSLEELKKHGLPGKGYMVTRFVPMTRMLFGEKLALDEK